MNFNFKTDGCAKCPFCFMQDNDMLHDIFNPCCRLKQVQGLEDFSINATFGTENTIDNDCPALHAREQKNILYTETKAKQIAENFWSKVDDNGYIKDSAICTGIDLISELNELVYRFKQIIK